MEKVTGYVTGVNGNLVSARFSGSVRKNEVGFVKIGNDRLKGEVIRVNGDTASMQIYIGIVGAVVIRLIVYVKGKNAKKYRKGAEYGSARWSA